MVQQRLSISGSCGASQEDAPPRGRQLISRGVCRADPSKCGAQCKT